MGKGCSLFVERVSQGDDILGRGAIRCPFDERLLFAHGFGHCLVMTDQPQVLKLDTQEMLTGSVQPIKGLFGFLLRTSHIHNDLKIFDSILGSQDFDQSVTVCE